MNTKEEVGEEASSLVPSPEFALLKYKTLLDVLLFFTCSCTYTSWDNCEIPPIEKENVTAPGGHAFT